MRIISMGLDDGMLVVAIGQRPVWRIGCFALTDVRYQLLFARVYFCNVLCYGQMFSVLDMIVIVFTVTMVTITSLCSSKIMIVGTTLGSESIRRNGTAEIDLYRNRCSYKGVVICVFFIVGDSQVLDLSREMTPQEEEGARGETTAFPIT
jgi:hypothetical protein